MNSTVIAAVAIVGGAAVILTALWLYIRGKRRTWASLSAAHRRGIIEQRIRSIPDPPPHMRPRGYPGEPYRWVEPALVGGEPVTPTRERPAVELEPSEPWPMHVHAQTSGGSGDVVPTAHEVPEFSGDGGGFGGAGASGSWDSGGDAGGGSDSGGSSCGGSGSDD